MSWRTAATALIVVFVMLLVWATLADPLVQIGNAFQGVETSGQFNTEQKIDTNIQAWFNMLLLAVFGVMGWAFWRVVRRELTRGQL